MTDITQATSSKGGFVRAGLGGAYLDLVQHLTPPLAGYLNMAYPILGTDLSFELVCAGEAALAALLIKCTPSHFADALIDIIVYIKTTIKRAKQAWDSP